MDFTTIGTVGSFIRQKNLAFAANYKIQTGQRVADANGNLQFAKTNMFDELMKANKKSGSEVDANKISSIKQKLMSGKKLSSEEMSYLREKDPKLYKKAAHAEEAREELKAALKHAKTKQEARQAVTQAMIKASAEASAELAAYKDGAGGGGVATSGYEAGQEVIEPVANVDGGAAEETPSMVAVNEQISETGEEMTDAAVEATKLEIQANQDAAETIQQANAEIAKTPDAETRNAENNSAQNSDADKNSPEDIVEKFLMTIRALEDEWAQFTKSKTFRKMPESKIDNDFKNDYKLADAPSRNVLAAIETYRLAMQK